MESNGPDVKVRGSAQQVLDKYLTLARDAVSAGNRVEAEGYFQYADHYYRLVNAASSGSNGQGRPDRGPRAPLAPAPAGSPPDRFEAASDDNPTTTGSPPKTEPETSPV